MISAALAFAITMLVLAMVVSTLVETIHRLLGMRERGLYYMLGQLYDRVLRHYDSSPQFRYDSLPQARSDPDPTRNFQDRMSENRAPVALTAPLGPALTSYPKLEWTPSGFVQWLGANWRGRGLSNLTTAGFMERLGRHPIGDGIETTAGDSAHEVPGDIADSKAAVVDAILQDIAQKFEAYANEASVFFERRARTLSIAVAVVVAFALHVNAIDIFKTFLRDPALAEAVVSRQGDLIKAVEAARTDAEKRTSQAPTAPSGAELMTFQQAKKDVEALKKEYTETIAQLNTAKTELSRLGIPIGWNDERKKAAAIRPLFAGIFIPTDWSVIWGLLFGGLLVGLGGPFWYDMIKSLTSIRDIARGLQSTSAATTPAGAAAAPAGAGGARETPQPRTPVDIFKAARAGWIAAGRPAS